MRELTRLLSTKSTILYLPPKGTDGFERNEVSGGKASHPCPRQVQTPNFSDVTFCLHQECVYLILYNTSKKSISISGIHTEMPAQHFRQVREPPVFQHLLESDSYLLHPVRYEPTTPGIFWSGLSVPTGSSRLTSRSLHGV